MKTTIELPDPLMTELVRAGLEGRRRGGGAAQPDDAEAWLAGWLQLADELMQDAPPGPAGRALLDAERNRLEHG
ncbi:MAG: hypothetical protein DCC57_06100 [Chloroflexi bacterium]|nr:MAG: hypothetical protein DCC57_06100 [Chloroflexota bacterium]